MLVSEYLKSYLKSIAFETLGWPPLFLAFFLMCGYVYTDVHLHTDLEFLLCYNTKTLCIFLPLLADSIQ